MSSLLVQTICTSSCSGICPICCNKYHRITLSRYQKVIPQGVSKFAVPMIFPQSPSHIIIMDGTLFSFFQYLM